MGIKEIANKANVSIATVSRVLNTPNLVKKNTRNKILRIAQELEYKKYNVNFPKLNINDEIGVIIPDITNSYFARILNGITKQAKELDLYVTLYLTHDSIESELKAAQKLIEKHISGVILIRSKNTEKESIKTVEKLNEANIPFVLVDRDIFNESNSGVFLSNANAVYDAVNMLIKNNYKIISILCGLHNNLNATQRLEGYKKALSKNSIIINEELIYKGDFSIKSGFEITSTILEQKNLPNVIFSCANSITLGCLKAICKKGLVVGKDIKLFSFNKLDAYNLDMYNISYIEHPVEYMGEKSVKILKNKLVGTKGIIRDIMDYKIQY